MSKSSIIILLSSTKSFNVEQPIRFTCLVVLTPNCLLELNPPPITWPARPLTLVTNIFSYSKSLARILAICSPISLISTNTNASL